LFAELSRRLYKGRVKARIVESLSRQKEMGLLSGEPQHYADLSVEALWAHLPELVAAKGTPRPDLDVAAALALGNLLCTNFDFGDDRRAVSSLFLIIMGRLNSPSKRFSQTDMQAISLLDEAVKRLREEIENDPLYESMSKILAANS